MVIFSLIEAQTSNEYSCPRPGLSAGASTLALVSPIGPTLSKDSGSQVPFLAHNRMVLGKEFFEIILGIWEASVIILIFSIA